MPAFVRTTGRAWAQSLGVLARSPVYVIALAVIGGLWAFAGYRWLWLTESSGWVLALALAWIIALAAIAVAVLAGGVASVSAVASGTNRNLRLRKILSFEKKRFGKALLIALAGVLLFLVLNALFGWVNGHALTVASFLTFHAQHPVSYMLIGKIFWVIEALIWIAVAGLLMTWLLIFSNPAPPTTPPDRSPGFPVFLTSLLSVVVFGGLAWLLATWRPIVKPGGWDYAQLILRNGIELLLLTSGCLFWAMALARIVLSRLTEPAASLPRS